VSKDIILIEHQSVNFRHYDIMSLYKKVKCCISNSIHLQRFSQTKKKKTIFVLVNAGLSF